MHDAFEQFAALTQDAADDQALLARGGKVPMPVLTAGAEKSFGNGWAEVLRVVASNVTPAIIPDSGHWIMEETPQATLQRVRGFLK